LIHDLLGREIIGRDAMDIPAAHVALIRSVRNIGRPGIASTAISAVDNALWDLKAKLVGLPLFKLLGEFRKGVPIYGSGGFTSYTTSQLQEQLAGWIEEGISRVKIKIGGDPHGVLERVRAARFAIGIQPELFVDANGAYTIKEALSLAEAMDEHQVSWFEEPVSSDDLEGLAFVRNHVTPQMEIAAGEYGYDPEYFDRMISSGAVDVVQIDATRCLGVTGFLRASAVCHTRKMPISAHTAPQIHAHICCSVPGARHVEYFFDHVRIENMIFDGAIAHKNGVLYPDLQRPGLGVELKRKDAERYA
jgi:L-alanine-DL-glutamate epimerase-like enolase superfamily enzyme